jgi:hypothetical protein
VAQPSHHQKDAEENTNMATQKFMGRGQLLERLTAQVGDKGLAIAILQKRGHLKADGKTYTQLGMKRNSMTAEERAKDRASKSTGRSKGDFKYNPKTNSVRLKK